MIRQQVTRGHIGIARVDGEEVKLWLYQEPAPTDPTEPVLFRYNNEYQLRTATWTASPEPRPTGAINARRLGRWDGFKRAQTCTSFAETGWVSAHPHTGEVGRIQRYVVMEVADQNPFLLWKLNGNYEDGEAIEVGLALCVGSYDHYAKAQEAARGDYQEHRGEPNNLKWSR